MSSTHSFSLCWAVCPLCPHQGTLLPHAVALPPPPPRSNNAGLEPVSAAESVCAGVCQQALGFCTDKDGDGVIDLGEGCLVVSGGGGGGGLLGGGGLRAGGGGGVTGGCGGGHCG
jgi:hypothetical protein